MCVSEGKMFVFWKIWRALLSSYFRFEIRSFALLPKKFATRIRTPDGMIINLTFAILLILERKNWRSYQFFKYTKLKVSLLGCENSSFSEEGKNGDWMSNWKKKLKVSATSPWNQDQIGIKLGTKHVINQKLANFL